MNGRMMIPAAMCILLIVRAGDASAETIACTTGAPSVFSVSSDLVAGGVAFWLPGGTASPAPGGPIAAADADIRRAPMTAAIMSATPALDGLITAWEYRSVPLHVNKAFFAAGNGRLGSEIWDPSWPGIVDDADYSARVFWAWDDTYLYLACQIADSEPFGGGDFTGDTLQVVIDPVGDGAGQFAIRSSLSETGLQTGYWPAIYVDPSLNGVAAPTGVAVASGPTANGYDIEMAIPWAGMGVTPAIGKQLGYLLAFVDVDSNGAGGMRIDEVAMTGGGAVNPFEHAGECSPLTLVAEIVPQVDDSDGDGLVDAVETDTGVFVDANDTGTDPYNPDTDGDGFPDGVEVAYGTDPNNPADFPTGLPAGGALGLAVLVGLLGMAALRRYRLPRA